MTLSLKQLAEAREALGAPLFAGLAGDVEVSFEFFPPKTEKMEATLWDTLTTLAPLGPKFVSVTYGAGGSTRERTHATVARIASETAIPAAAHLTCVDASRDEIDSIAQSYWDAGVRHIVALRGDPPRMGEKFVAHPRGYANAAELVKGLKQVAPFEISVAAYPETHPDADCADSDIDNLDVESAVYLGGPAGSITAHNCRCVHGSAPNRAEKPRPLLLCAYSAAHAIPITNLTAHGKYAEAIVRGQRAKWAEFDSRPVLMPPDWSKTGHKSIFEHQQREQ